jgi:hypothetical protein
MSPTQALSAALQIKSPKNMACQSSAQALMNAIQSNELSRSLCSAQTQMITIQPKENSSAAQNITVYTICDTETPRRVSKADKASSKALKDLLVISSQTPVKLTCSRSTSGTPSEINKKTAKAETSPLGKENCSANQKGEKTNVGNERTKSRSYSEDADFYAGSAILNSPSPHFVPLPDFDESYDFFTVENRFNVVESVRAN